MKAFKKQEFEWKVSAEPQRCFHCTHMAPITSHEVAEQELQKIVAELHFYQ